MKEKDGYQPIPETVKPLEMNIRLLVIASHYPLPENILDQTKSVQLKSMQQNWLAGWLL